MSIVGILGSNLFSGAAAGLQGSQGTAPKFEQIKEQFQQLGQDLQSGNIAQAQTDYATLSGELPGGSQAGATAAATTAAATAAANAAATTGTTSTAAGTTTTTGATSLSQQFAQLGQDLQSGNLQAAQQDYTNIQQTAQQNGTQQTQGLHHRGHHHHGGGGSQTGSATSASSQQSNPIAQAFSTLSQDLTAGNLSGAQSAFATLQNDLQQIGGFASSGSGSTSPTSTSASASTAGSLSVSA